MSIKYHSPIHPEPEIQKEMDFIRQVLANNLAPDRPFPTIPRNINWEVMAEILEDHRLASIFFSLLSARPEEFPGHFLSRLKKARYELLIYGDSSVKQVRNILAEFNKYNVRAIVLKGWAMIPTLYGGDYAKRFCEDIDILIHVQDIELVESFLQSIHYVGYPEVHPGYSRRFSNARAYVHSDPNVNNLRAFSIGLHWGLTHYPCFNQDRVKISDLFDRAIPLDISGMNTLQLSPADHLIYSCAHLALHHRNQETLLQYYEIASNLIQHQEVLNWDQLMETAFKWGYQAQLKKTLLDLVVIWPGIIQKNIFQSLLDCKIPWKERFIDHLVARTKGRPFRSALVQLIAMQSWRDKISSAIQQLFPSREYMLTRYPSGDQSLFHLYFRRITGSLMGMIRD